MNETTVSYYVYPGIFGNIDSKFEDLIAKACEIFGITLEEFFCKWRRRKYVDARKAVAYISHYHLHINKIDISRRTNKDHTTTLFQIKSAEDLIETDPYFKSVIDHLTKRIFI